MEKIKEKLKLLPDQPGCYLMKDENETIIYVGKAKILKNRVKSYFTGSHDTKTQKLVSEIKDFEYIVTSSNTEALLLEVNLIKKHKPKYNILLKDDKNYPYLKITNEKHPRLITTRKITKDGSKYFGPYPNAGSANEVKKILDRIYPLRKCDTLPKKVCLYYHIGQCVAPCEFNVEKEEKELVEKISKFLKGDYKEVKKELHSKMLKSSENMDFEKAKEYRDQIVDIETVMEKQKINLKDLIDRDVFGYFVEKDWICIQVFFIRSGKMVEREVFIQQYYREPEEELASFIAQFYMKSLKPKEILIPENLDHETIEEVIGVKILVPKIGEKKSLVELANKNAELALKEKLILLENKKEKTQKALEELSSVLGINRAKRIEAFDNSNIQGTDAVSAMVVFTDGKPDKKEYRKYKIKTVIGPDDYSSMKEVVRRRYKKVLTEKLPLPDLIVIDGGKGQINAAKEVLEDEYGLNIPICGLAKDEKHKTSELISGETLETIELKKNSEAFYLMQRIQDEVHRFAITFFRQTHQKTTLKSKLDEIKGVGEKRKKILYSHFKTTEKMKNASIEEYKKLGIPENIARKIIDEIK